MTATHTAQAKIHADPQYLEPFFTAGVIFFHLDHITDTDIHACRLLLMI